MQIVVFAAQPLNDPAGAPDVGTIGHPVGRMRCLLFFFLPVLKQAFLQGGSEIFISEAPNDPRGDPAKAIRH